MAPADGLPRGARNATYLDRLPAVGASTPTAGGTVSYAADGSFTYAPTAGFFGSLSFTASIRAADGASAQVTVTVDVGAAHARAFGRARAYTRALAAPAKRAWAGGQEAGG